MKLRRLGRTCHCHRRSYEYQHNRNNRRWNRSQRVGVEVVDEADFLHDIEIGV